MRRSLFTAWMPLAMLASALLPASALADPIDGFIDAYYQPYSQLKSQSDDGNGGSVTTTDHGDGYGAKGLLRLTEQIAADGEYQRADYQGAAKRDDWRAGGGYYWRYFGVAADYIKQTVNDGSGNAAADGVGLYLRTSWLAIRNVAFTGAVGYVRLEHSGDTYDGLEYNVGLDVRLYDALGVFADFRSTDLKNNGLDLRGREVRTGLRLVF